MGPNIVSDGLIFCVDASNDKSYVSGSNSTTWKDLTNTADVTLLNGPTFSTDNSGCIVFDGNDDNSQFSNIVSRTANTVSAWVYNEDLSQDGTVVGNWGAQFILYMDTGGAGDGYRTLYSTDGAGTKGTSSDSINAIQDQWQNVVATFSGTQVKLYVDGELVSNSSIFSSTTMADDSGNWAIGADTPNGARDFEGRIAYVSFYDKALSADEVKQNYNALKPRFGL
jgi:hypothetical protein